VTKSLKTEGGLELPTGLDRLTKYWNDGNWPKVGLSIRKLTNPEQRPNLLLRLLLELPQPGFCLSELQSLIQCVADRMQWNEAGAIFRRLRQLLLDHKELNSYETRFVSAAEKIAKCVFNLHSGNPVFDEAADVYFFQDYGACLLIMEMQHQSKLESVRQMISEI